MFSAEFAFIKLHHNCTPGFLASALLQYNIVYTLYVDSAFKTPCTFLDALCTIRTRSRNILLHFNVIFDASYTFSTRPKIH